MEQFIDILLGKDAVAPEIFSADIVAFNLALAFALAAVTALTYKRVHKGVSYSQSFVVSIVLVSMVVALAMMVIGNDITRAFALLGTFTIIRYRTAVKDPKDTAFIFISLVVGLAVGSTNYSIAIVGTLMLNAASLLLHFMNFGAAVKREKVLYLSVNTKLIDSEKLEDAIKSSFTKTTLLDVNFVREGSKLVYSYNVEEKSKAQEDKFIKAVAKLKGVESAEILASQNLIEF